MLSICIPAYTYAAYTAEAVASVLACDEDIELVVVEDFDLLANNPNVREQVERTRDLLRSDPRIWWVRNKQPLPIQENWNYTVSLSTRPYVKLMGADDRLCPEKAHDMMTMLADHPHSVMHGHLSRVIDNQGNVMRLQRPYTFDGQPLVVSGRVALQLKLAQTARFKDPVCNIYKRSAWETVGGYRSTYGYAFDIAFNIDMMRAGECTLWSDYFTDVRRHGRSNGARLPADLALNDLRALVNAIYAYLDDGLEDEDRANGEAWILYRALELMVTRYRSNPWDSLMFLLKSKGLYSVRAKVLVKCLEMGMRRLRQHDVQKTVGAKASLDDLTRPSPLTAQMSPDSTMSELGATVADQPAGNPLPQRWV